MKKNMKNKTLEQEYIEIINNPKVQKALQNIEEKCEKEPELMAVRNKVKNMLPLQKLDTYCDILLDKISHFGEKDCNYLIVSTIIGYLETLIMDTFCDNIDIDMTRCIELTDKNTVCDNYMNMLKNIRKRIKGNVASNDSNFVHDLFSIFMSGNTICEFLHEKEWGF